MKINKSWYIKPKDKNFPTSVSAGGTVVRKEKERLFIALIRDKKFGDFMLPKGRVEVTENLENAATRKIAEETGLKNLKLICKLGVRERLTYEKDSWRTVHYFLFVTNQKSSTQNLQEGEDDYIVEWFDLDKLPSFFWPEQKELVEENREKIKKLVSNFYHSS